MPGQSAGSKSTRCLIKYIALFLPSNSSSDSTSYTKNLPEKTSNVARKADLLGILKVQHPWQVPDDRVRLIRPGPIVISEAAKISILEAYMALGATWMSSQISCNGVMLLVLYQTHSNAQLSAWSNDYSN